MKGNKGYGAHKVLVGRQSSLSGVTFKEPWSGDTIENGHEAILVNGVHIHVVQSHLNLRNIRTAHGAVAVEETGEARRIVHQGGGGGVIPHVVGGSALHWVGHVGGSSAAGYGGSQLAARSLRPNPCGCGGGGGCLAVQAGLS